MLPSPSRSPLWLQDHAVTIDYHFTTGDQMAAKNSFLLLSPGRLWKFCSSITLAFAPSGGGENGNTNEVTLSSLAHWWFPTLLFQLREVFRR